MWATYASAHRGRTNRRGNKRVFRVQGIVGTGSPGFDLEVSPVTYNKQPPPLDSLLELAMLLPAVREHTWMKSKLGEPSVRLREVTGNVDSWRDAHWEKLFECATWKHPDWAHEEE